MAEKGPPAPTPKLKKKFPVTGQTARTEHVKSTKSTSQFA